MRFLWTLLIIVVLWGIVAQCRLSADRSVAPGCTAISDGLIRCPSDVPDH